jgi:diguanylate cyclase (GGDEF)-like protein
VEVRLARLLKSGPRPVDVQLMRSGRVSAAIRHGWSDLPGMVILSILAGSPLLLLSGSPAGAWYGLLASTLMAYIAAATAGSAAIRTVGRTRGGWILLGLASFGWAVGNTLWSWNELVAHTATLFPSWADLGYLMFPVAGTAGLWLLSEGSSPGSRWSLLLDGLIFTGSLLAISWSTSMAAIYHAGGDSSAAFLVSLAYPCGDLVLGTMGFLLAARTRRGRRGVIALVILGLTGMMVSDTFFAVLQANSTYFSGAPSDAGWIIGFTALACAGRLQASRPLALNDEGLQPRWQLLLPYFPFGTAVIISVAQLSSGDEFDRFQIVLVLVVLALVMMRQMATLLHNSTLIGQLRHQAFHDALTGLPNRALFTDRLEHALARRARGGNELVVVCLDLDDFKLVNDSLGHDAGDALLRGIAERLRACCHPADTVARLGGDEFAMIVEASDRPERVARKILNSLQDPFLIPAGPVSASASIGIATTAVLPVGIQLSSADLMKQVDLALYEAKSRGKRNFAVFEPVMWHDFDEEMSLRHQLTLAVEQGTLTVVHQPIHELAGGRILGVEALARWRDGTLGEVPPARFIPVAERAHLIVAIGEFVLDRACQEFARWNVGLDKYLSVNVSPLQLLDPDFPETAMATVLRHGLNPTQLVLEVTETALAEESQIAVVLRRLRAEGFRIAIDDFGTGYSSLRYLHHFPVDIIKIDRSYVGNIDQDEDAARLLSALLQMISTLNLICIAEGIETQAQADQLNGLGCPYGQGYLFSRPMPLALLTPQVAPKATAPHS